MKTIALIGQKGGCGKSTLAVGLAVSAFRAKQAAVVIDVDPQATAANWKDRREGNDNPAVVSAQASRLKQTLAVAEEADADLVIIDTAGRSDDSSIAAARVADLVLIPSRPNILELETLPAVADILRLAGSPPAFVVLNGIHPSATKQADEAREIVAGTFGLNCAPSHISQRSAYADAMATGRTPQELDPDGKAAAELDALYRFVYEIVNNRTGEQYEQNGHFAKEA